MKPEIRSARVLCCALLLIAACARPDEPVPADAPPAPQAAEEDSVFAPDSARVVLARDRIYFSLTRFDWYARGEPLVHGSAAYQPAGFPVAASLSDMTHAGEYQGVDYYTREGDDGAVVYVPVYEGYWQVFRADTAARRVN